MIDALVGAVIMVVATTSLVYSLEVAQKAFAEAGRYPLNASEERLLKDFGLDEGALKGFWENNIANSKDQWGAGSE